MLKFFWWYFSEWTQNLNFFSETVGKKKEFLRFPSMSYKTVLRHPLKRALNIRFTVCDFYWRAKDISTTIWCCLRLARRRDFLWLWLTLFWSLSITVARFGFWSPCTSVPLIRSLHNAGPNGNREHLTGVWWKDRDSIWSLSLQADSYLIACIDQKV